MKIYEYLAAGLPVLAKTNHANLKDDFNDLLTIIPDGDGLSSVLEECKKLKSDPAWNKRRLEFIQQSSWTHRARSVLDSLNPDS